MTNSKKVHFHVKLEIITAKTTYWWCSFSEIVGVREDVYYVVSSFLFTIGVWLLNITLSIL